MTTNPLIAKFAGEPALIEAGASDRFKACLDAVMAHELAPYAMVSAASAGDEFWTELGERVSARLRPYVVADGILYIPVKGVLLKDFPYQFFDLATGYEYIRAAFDRGLDDSNVKGIAFIVDSPGGMVAGCFDTVDRIHEGRGRKPIMGFADEHAYSAAYGVISAVDPARLAVARTGGVGSIGVVTSHIDASGAYEQMGIKITFIHAGKHKVDGNSTEPLPADVKARIQARIDELYEVFVSTVARNRGMDAQAVRDTEALTFTATQAVSNGLADSIGSLDDAVAAFAADLSSTSGDEEMSDQGKTAVDQAAVDNAVAAAQADAANNQAAAVAAAVTADRERQKAIMGSEEAKGRETLANHIALNTDMSVEDAKAMLAVAPKQEAASGGQDTPFDAAMGGGDNPNVGGGGGDKPKVEEDGADGVLALVSGVGLSGFKQTKR